MTQTMRAAQLVAQATGSSFPIKLARVPLPTPDEGQVLVKVASSSVCPADVAVCQGKLGQLTVPKVPSGDVAGVVVSDGKKFKKGDKVISFETSFLGSSKDGAWAEYMVVNEARAAHAPKNFPLSKAGVVPIAALTAFQALAKGDPQPGQRCLVHSGAGGVGSWAVQLAKVHYKMYVVATAGPANQQYLKDIGADEVVDYTTQDFEALYKDKRFQLVIDIVGRDTELRSYSLLAEGATFSHIANPAHTDEARQKSRPEIWTKGRTWAKVLVSGDAAQLQQVAQYLDAGVVQQHISAVYPLEKAADALASVAQGHTRGKVCISLEAED